MEWEREFGDNGDGKWFRWELMCWIRTIHAAKMIQRRYQEATERAQGGLERENSLYRKATETVGTGRDRRNIKRWRSEDLDPYSRILYVVGFCLPGYIVVTKTL